MSSDFSNDNDALPTPQREPDAYGQAALLLVESLIHGLIARQLLSVADAVEVVDAACEVSDLAADSGETLAIVQNPIHLLQAISASLSFDLPK